MSARILLLAFVAISLTGSLFAQTDAAAVRDAFQAYRAAMDSRNGEAARSYVTRASLNSYETLRDEALYAVKTDLEQRPIYERLIILNLRLRFGLEELQRMPGSDLFKRGIEQGWTAGSSGPSALENLIIAGDHAQARVAPREGGEGTQIRFALEEGGWKIDLVSMAAAVEERLKEIAKLNGIGEDELIEETLSAAYGQALPANIWEPRLR